MYLNAFIPFELRHIRQPLLVGLFSVEVPVQKVLGYVLRVLGLPCAAVVGIFNRGLNPTLPADTKHALVVDWNPVVDLQIIPEPTVTFLRLVHVHLLQLVSNLFVFLLPR